MKNKQSQGYDYNVSTWVNYDVKKKLYEIAERENRTISNIVREIIEKGVVGYGNNTES